MRPSQCAVLEAAAKRWQDGETDRLPPRDRICLEAELEPLQERLERDERAGETRQARRAFARGERAPTGAHVRPEGDLAVRVEVREQEPAAAARAEDGA